MKLCVCVHAHACMNVRVLDCIEMNFNNAIINLATLSTFTPGLYKWLKRYGSLLVEWESEINFYQIKKWFYYLWNSPGLSKDNKKKKKNCLRNSSTGLLIGLGALEIALVTLKVTQKPTWYLNWRLMLGEIQLWWTVVLLQSDPHSVQLH